MLLIHLLLGVPKLSLRTYNSIDWPRYPKVVDKPLKWVIVFCFMIILATNAIILALPYKSAKERLAYSKYKATTLYRERLVEFGEQFALDAYIQFDRSLFVARLTWQDKLKALIIPYSCV